jgi:hypothetical protein
MVGGHQGQKPVPKERGSICDRDGGPAPLGFQKEVGARDPTVDRGTEDRRGTEDLLMGGGDQNKDAVECNQWREP